MSRIERKYIEDAYPLSPMQEMILFHSLYAPAAGIYITQLSCTLAGLDVAAFKLAWQQAVDRHSILRTAFAWKNTSRPLQVVGRNVGVPLQQQDCRSLTSREQEERLKMYLQEDRVRGFNPSKAPLMRLALFRFVDDVYQFVWSHHHVLLDGWSAHRIFRELLLFYEAFCEGQRLQLEPCRPYRDYIVWLEHRDLSTAETYWRHRLRGYSVPFSLSVNPTSKTVSDKERSFDERQITLPAATASAVRSFAKRHGLTPNTLVQGGWALLLSRYSDKKDVVFGSVVSGRPPELPGVESIVGLLVNTLPMRVEISPKESVLSWLKLLQQQQSEMREYEYSPLLQVQQWSDIPSGHPLFESILAFQNYPVDTAAFEQSTVLKVRNYKSLERNNFPLAVVIGGSAQWFFKIIYDCDRFDAATVIQILEHYKVVIEQIIMYPGWPLVNIPFLSEGGTNVGMNMSHTLAQDELEQFDFPY